MERRHKEGDINEDPPQQLRKTLDALVATLIKPDELRRDLFLAMLLIVMQDSGFQLMKDHGDTPISIVDFIIIARKKQPDHYNALYFLKGHGSIPLRLIIKPMKDVFLINCTLPDMCKETYSLCLPINRYVVKSSLGIPSNFANMDELNTVFKDRIVTPIKSVILNYNSSSSGALAALPTDILQVISLRLPIKDVLNLSASCKRINGLVNEEILWAQLFARDFDDVSKMDVSSKCCYWKAVYKQAYIQKKEEERKRVCIPVDDRYRDFELPGFVTYSSVSDSRWQVIL